jgi:diacylglycerol kinase (ATP)
MVKLRTLLECFNCAFDGVVYAFKTQRNMRLHFLATGLVLLLSLVFQLTKLEILVLFLTIALVIVTEMINTAIEVTIDLITQERHPKAAIAKNVAAGAVLVTATLAAIVGYVIFFPKFDPLIPMVITSLKKAPAYLSLIAILLTIVLVIVGKALTKKGRPVQGGMPSGHTALAASAATAISFLAANSLVTCLVSFMVLLVAGSRVENKIHSVGEVIVGGLLGFLITLLIFQLMF